ncbi:uncharacterized protein PHALS_13622 [Plasmopara halstedii]|uniref:Uncharacterized protein n=1 Tax=Plasmopara halstedii TaxID=4781 RepID=A0A0N7L667_PLAHL|nr:uncharacterized protein PHALS_13622 [Plasmopara halstedii]CEG43427.1 hypothetical protein PHALS_13622 [Plasmopara halstedii]|eukprot:XP_024579796.1 hypothetical protein PHALS_13622 [Plasmopara halstedii]
MSQHEEVVDVKATPIAPDCGKEGASVHVHELPTSYLIEHLLTKETFDVHAIRLKHYADDMLIVTEELKHHVSFQGINLGVRAAKGGRFNRQSKE